MPTRSLKLIAPFRCRFNLDNARTIENSDAVDAFMRRLNKDYRMAKARYFSGMPEGVNLIVEHMAETPVGADSRFISLNQPGNSLHSPEYFRIEFDALRREDVRMMAAEAARNADMICDYRLSHILQPQTDKINVSICDDTIALLSLDVAIESQLTDEDYAALDAWTTHMTYYLLGGLHRDYVSPTVACIQRYAEELKTPFIRNPKDFVVYRDMATPKNPPSDYDPHELHFLWVNRTFILPYGEERHGATQRIINACPRIESVGSGVYLGWGNNVIELESDEPGDLEDIWSSMRLAQHCYAVMDVISHNLTRYVGSAYDSHSNRELRDISRTMGAVMNAVTIFQVRYKDLRTELQGAPREVFKRLVEAWDFDELYRNVEEKATVCRSNVQRLNHCINQRNSVRVQMALAMVAGIGIIRLMIGLSDYRFEEDDGVLGLLDVSRMFAPDEMVWMGVIMALGVCIFIAANRPR